MITIDTQHCYQPEMSKFLSIFHRIQIIHNRASSKINLYIEYFDKVLFIVYFQNVSIVVGLTQKGFEFPGGNFKICMKLNSGISRGFCGVSRGFRSRRGRALRKE